MPSPAPLRNPGSFDVDPGEYVPEAAWRLQQAGFDAVELHAAHGYLISQFMSPVLNNRIDRFGGSFENRMRFPLAIVASIQNKCGWDFPVIIRYSVDEWVPGGRELPESIEVAKRFEQAGELGGAILGCCVAPGKEKMKWYADWIRYQIEDLKVEVKLNTEPKAADLKGFDIVVNATGASSYAPKPWSRNPSSIR